MSDIENNGGEKDLTLTEKQTAVLQETYGDAVRIFTEDFNFRSSKDLPENADAANWPKQFKTEIVDGKTVEVVKGFKRNSITLPLFRPSLDSVRTMLADGESPETSFILALLDDAVYAAAYQMLSADPSLTAETFPLDKLSFYELARLPREAKTRGIDKELLAAFCADYVAAMPEITGKDEARCKVAADQFADRFGKAKQQPEALVVLQKLLDVYATQAPNAGDYAVIITYLSKKLEEYIAAGTVDLASMLE